MSTIYDIALAACNTKNAIARDRKALATCDAEDEHILDENIANNQEYLEYLMDRFTDLEKDAPANSVRSLRYAIRNNHIESLITQMAHL